MTASPVPQGSVRVRVEHNEISFAVPRGMTNVSKQTKNKTAQNPALKDLARKNGVSTQDLRQQMDQSDLFLTSPNPKGYGPAVTISVSREASNLGGRPPSDQDLIEAIAAVHGTAGNYRSFTGTTGQGGMMDFTLKTKGYTVHGVYMAVPNKDRKLATVSIYAQDQKTGDRIAKTISQTVESL